MPGDGDVPTGFERLPREGHLLFRRRGLAGPDLFIRLDHDGKAVRCSTCIRVGLRSVLADWVWPVGATKDVQLAVATEGLRRAVAAGNAMNRPRDATA